MRCTVLYITAMLQTVLDTSTWDSEQSHQLVRIQSPAHVSQAEPKLDILHRFPIDADPASTKNSSLLHLGTVGPILHCFAPGEALDAPLFLTCKCAVGNVNEEPHSHWFM